MYLGTVGNTLLLGSVLSLGVPVLAFFGYLGAAILSIWVLADIWRKK